MADSIRIASTGGTWGDDPSRLRRRLEVGPVDYLAPAFLGPLTPPLLQRQRSRDPRLGYAREFVAQVEEALPLLRAGAARIVTDAGGVNPPACRGALLETVRLHGAALEVAAVLGDDLLPRLGELNATGVTLDHAVTGAPFAAIREQVSSAHADLGARPAAQALCDGARIVVTGWSGGGGAVLAAMIHAFDWAEDDWDRLAAGAIAAHLAAGDDDRDFEVAADGSFVVGADPGGGVSLDAIRERLIERMGDPRAHAVADVTADLASVRLERAGPGRVRVWGVRGRAPAGPLEVEVRHFAGWWASGALVLAAPGAAGRARALAARFWERLGHCCQATRTEVVGASACWGDLAPPCDPPEVLLRLAARDGDRAKVERFARALAAFARSAPAGVAAVGPESGVEQVVARWPARVPRERAPATLVTRDGERTLTPAAAAATPVRPRALAAPRWPTARGSRRLVAAPLSALARARSGDRGDALAIGVVARAPEVYPWLEGALTAAVVKRRFRGICRGRVERRAVPNLHALGFVLNDAMDGDAARALRIDPQGRTLAAALLAMEMKVPQAMLDAAARADAGDGGAPSGGRGGRR